jgi:hypothetical protein
MDYWNTFRVEVRDLKGVPHPPNLPDPGFLLQHYEVALQLIAKKKAASPPLGSLEKKETCTMPVASPPPKVVEKSSLPKPTQDDVAQTIADLEAILKSKG